jgi:putative N6-adenine-specific DNA methylase
MMNRVLLNRMKGCFSLEAVSTISVCRVVLLSCRRRRRHYASTSVLLVSSSAGQNNDHVKKPRGQHPAKQTTNKIPTNKNKATSKQMQQQQQQHTSYTKPKSQQFQAPFSAFISCLPGLEPLLLKEVEYLHSHRSSNDHRNKASNPTKEQQPHILPGGVKLTVPSLHHIYILHLYLGTASHIYLRLNDDNFDGLPPLFRARGFPELQRKVKDLIISQRWDEWLNITAPSVGDNSEKFPLNVQVHVTTSKSKLMHTKAVEERVKQTIGEVITNIASDSNESDTTPCIRIMLRIERDVVQLSLDTSLTPLHRRGYRLKPHKAPLREDLGYALLMSGGLMPCWDLRPHSLSAGSTPPSSSIGTRRVLLFDPFCGSGTIAIEGASLQLGLPPGRFHPAPLGGTSFCNPELWEEMKSKALSASSAKRHDSISVAAGDIDPKAIDAAKANAKRAGVDECIGFVKGSFVFHPLLHQSKQGQKSKTFDASQSLLIVANPPYGKRLPDETKNNSIYKKLAKVLSSSSSSSSSRSTDCAIIGKDVRIMRESGMPLDVAFSTKHGGLNVVAMAGSLMKPQGS